MGRKTDSSFNDLLFDNDIGGDESTVTLRISEIEPNKSQPRKTFDNESLKQLADSIKEHGILQPILVKSTSVGSYKIIAGERRWRAAKMAGLSEVPVLVRDDLSEEQAAQIALIENLQRENLNPVEEALGYKELLDEYSMTQEQLSKALGKARSSIANSLGLLTLPDEVKKLLADGKISSGHCKVLKSFKDEGNIIQAAKLAAKDNMSVRELEDYVKSFENAKAEEKKKKRIKQKANYYTEIEASLSDILETKVRINEGKRSNILQIEFSDEEFLRNIVERFFMEEN
ncbi:MAG: ParB/RepB/Spo0J family partition protein [Oscillospiraceae bacterium]|nr:ParB/RepB/Spo0J family partition protein [Oscillospiraceae bacterium]